MSRPARWALSPLDLQAHLLLPEGCHPKGVLKARCGHLLPMRAIQFAQTFARKCSECHLISLSDAILALRRENPAPISPRPGRPPVVPSPPSRARRPTGPPCWPHLRTEVTHRSGEGTHHDRLSPRHRVDQY